MPAPLLSVIIPTWNRAGWICDAIDSALQQGEPGTIEVIVIDDGSTDNTRELLQKKYHKKIVYQQLSKKNGTGHARNKGIALASGELIAFLDSDDVWLPGKLATERALFTRYPQTQVVISDSLSFIEGLENKLSRFEFNGLSASCLNTSNQEYLVSESDWLWTNCENSVATCSITLKRNLLPFLGIPLFAEDLISCEDWELELKLYQFCQVRITTELLAHVRSFTDATRVERAATNTARTHAQTICLLQNRKTVMARIQLAPHLPKKLHQEYQRMRILVDQQLQSLLTTVL